MYTIQYLLTFKKRCHKKPKDLRQIDLPLKSKSEAHQIEQIPEEMDNAESLRNLRILLNKISRDNFSRVSDTILNTFAYNKEILEEFVVLFRLYFSE